MYHFCGNWSILNLFGLKLHRWVDILELVQSCIIKGDIILNHTCGNKKLLECSYEKKYMNDAF